MHWLIYLYGKCFKILNTFLFLFSNKMLVIRVGIHKKLDRIANRDDPEQTSEAVRSWSVLFVKAFLEGNEFSKS